MPVPAGRMEDSIVRRWFRFLVQLLLPLFYSFFNPRRLRATPCEQKNSKRARLKLKLSYMGQALWRLRIIVTRSAMIWFCKSLISRIASGVVQPKSTRVSMCAHVSLVDALA